MKFVVRFYLVMSLFLFGDSEIFARDTDNAFISNYENVYLYRIVISPFRIPQEIKDIPQNISVLDSEDIYSLPVSDPAELVANIPGVDVSSRTRFGHFTPLSIQGSESRHVLVMMDGIPFNTQASGQADILSALPLQALDRVEVIKGSASSAWGTSLGGVVHLVSKMPEASPVPKGHVTASIAEFRSQKQNFDATGAAGKLGYYFSGEFGESGGARTKGGTHNRDDTQIKKGFGKFVYPLSDILKATASYGYSGADVNEGVYPSDGTRNHVPYYARYALFKLDMEKSESQRMEFALKSNRQLISVDSLDGISEVLSSNVRTQDNYSGAEFKNISSFREKDTLVLGGDVAFHVLKSSQLESSKNISYGAPFGNYTWVSSVSSVTAGARYDFNQEFGDQFNPSIGAVFHAPNSTDALLRFNINRSFSAPPVLWKYFKDVSPGFTANNPYLNPERAWNYEAGFEVTPYKPWRAAFKVFHSDISDAIATVRRQDGLFIKDNFNKFEQRGFEFETEYTASKNLSLYFSADFHDVKNALTNTPIRGRGVTRPGYRLGLEYKVDSQDPARPLRETHFHLIGRYDRWDASSASMPNDRKFIFDGRIIKPLATLKGADISCFLNGFNLTNSKYWSDRDYPLPQRYFETGLTLEF